VVGVPMTVSVISVMATPPTLLREALGEVRRLGHEGGGGQGAGVELGHEAPGHAGEDAAAEAHAQSVPSRVRM
jgi:hypothetical protein